MNTTTLGAAIALALSASVGVALAQAPESQQGREKGTRTEGPAGGGGATMQQQAQPRPAPDVNRQGAPNAAHKAQQQTQSSEPSRRRAEERATNQQTNQQKSDTQRNRNAQNQDQGNTNAQPKTERRNAAEAQQKGNVQRKGETTGQRPGNTAANPAGGSPQASQPNQQPNRAAADAGGNRVTLNDQQWAQVRNRLRAQRVRNLTNSQFDRHPGAHVPRSVRLFALPAVIAGMAPEYRTYRYFLADGEVYIVDPATYEIVTVVGPQGRAAPVEANARPRGLVLSPDQRMFVLSTINLDSQPSLGIGGISENMPVPGRVELRDFSPVILEHVPELRPYRYFVSERQLAVVDPGQQKIVLILSR